MLNYTQSILSALCEVLQFTAIDCILVIYPKIWLLLHGRTNEEGYSKYKRYGENRQSLKIICTVSLMEVNAGHCVTWTMDTITRGRWQETSARLSVDCPKPPNNFYSSEPRAVELGVA